MQKHAFRALAGAFVASTAALAASWPGVAAAQSASIASSASYACDFENSYCGFSEQSKVGDAPPSSLRRSAIVAPGRSGSYAVRLHTEPGDDQVHGSGTWERDDLTLGPDASYCNEGQEEWWAVSVLFPSDYVFPPPGDGGVVLDFHHNADGGLPNFSVDTMGDTGMRTRGYGGPAVNGGQYGVQIADPYGAVNNVTRNVWYDFVFHVKWSSSANGVMEGWLNGRKFQSYSGATLYSGISCYLKLANYHAAFGQPSSIVFDRMVRGTSAAAVAIGALEGVDGGVSTTTPVSSPTPAPTSTGGTASASATMDSSAYAIAAGQSVTFTARILGNGATPGGSVSFASDGGAIAGCSNVVLSGGAAQCTTSTLPGGQHGVTGTYSGDATYGPAQAGPITQTVAGSLPTATAPSSPTPSAPALPTSFGMDSSAYTSSVGAAVTFTATIPGAGGTVSFRDNANPIAGCSAAGVSSSGIATCSTSALAAGTHAITGTYSGNGSYAAGVAGPITQTVATAAAQAATSASALNVQGLWWGGASESGWGVNVVQQGSVLFATWFTYDAQGRGEWLVMPNGANAGSNRYSGALYRTTGPSFTAAAFDPSSVSATPVGTATFSFADAGNGTFSATLDGRAVSKTIVRETFDARTPTCSEGAVPDMTNYQDLWWRAGGAESGWGINLTHQGDTIFMTWFTYDTDGSALWLVAPNLAKDGNGNYSGAVYRTTGPAFDSAWDPSRVSAAVVGAASLSFTDASNGTLSYTVDAASGSKPIAREVFAAPPTACRAS